MIATVDKNGRVYVTGRRRVPGKEVPNRAAPILLRPLAWRHGLLVP